MRALLLIVLIMCAPVFAAEPADLVGVWKVVSWQVIVDNEPPQDVFGLHPKGYLILTREGRAIALTTADNRKPGTTDAERAALHRSMLAYTGKYRIEGHFRIEGDKLFIDSAPAPSIVFPGKTDFRRIVWEREKNDTARF